MDNKTDSVETLEHALSDWLTEVNQELRIRRSSQRPTPHHRNRARERARREAYQLFMEFYADRALAHAQG